MLNELFDLKTSMYKVGIKTISWHENYKNCPKTNKTFFVLISNAGTIVELELINKREKIEAIRKYGVSNSGFSFPAFNVPPLLNVISSEALGKLKTLKEELKSKNVIDISKVNDLCEACDQIWDESQFKRINRCLNSAGLKEKLYISFPAPEDYRAIEELIKRSEKLNAGVFQESLKKLIICHIAEMKQDADEFIDLLVNSSRNFKSISLVLELADRSKFIYPATSQKVQEWINQRLMEHETSGSAVHESFERDAFGQPILESDYTEKFPEVNLPIIGNVKLRAMYHAHPCQRRYGRIDSESFPAGKKVRQEMKDALEWLGDKRRKGKTWENITGVDGKKQSILFAYPSVLVEDPPELTTLFAPEGESTDPDGAKFEAAAARVIPALQGIVNEHPNAEVRVIVLAKMDKARTKVLVSKHCNARLLISGAQAWQDGCRNIPEIKLNLGTEDNPKWIDSRIPYPSDVVKCLNIKWPIDCKKANPVHGLGIGEGISLLMDTGPVMKSILERALYLSTTNAISLILSLGHEDHRRDRSIKIDGRYPGHIYFIPSLLGLLLYKLNILKGDYMSSAPFLIGRLLSMADTLHREYCRNVRKNEIPPQLLGNALMTTAIDNPERGLSILCNRLMPYQAWANKVEVEEGKLAKWIIRQMGQVSNELAAIVIPKYTTDADKAQMLLGYLARPESKSFVKQEISTNISNMEA